jgi:alpha-L-arabinofuranosidase
LVFFVAGSCTPQPISSSGLELTNIVIQDQVIQQETKRFGINLGTPTFYDAGQIMKNLLYRNPGFEGALFQSIIQCRVANEHTCTDGNRYAGWKDGFWDGAAFEVATGASKGSHGKVIHSTAPDGKLGIRLDLSPDSSMRLSAGDNIILRRQSPDNPTAGWWPETKGGATMSGESDDLPPGSAGKQALKVQVSSRSQSAALRSYFGDGRYIKLRGQYRLRFSAKSLGQRSHIDLRLSRQLPTQIRSFLSRRADLSTTWQTFSFAFEANEIAAPQNGLELLLYFESPSSVLLDEFSLEETGRTSADAAPFLPQVVDTLRELNPGILRDWSNQLGESLENWTAPREARQRAVFSAFSADNDVSIGIHEFLQLTESIGAEPWIVIPTVFSLEEASNLIEYLAGPPDSTWGKIRVARGHSAPWTDSAKCIHLEFGNEAWNGIFAGGSIEDAAAYGSRARDIFTSMRNSRWFHSQKFDLVIGGQSGYPERNSRILAAASGHDSFAVAPYTASSIDHFANIEELFGSLFAEADDLVNRSYTHENSELSRHAKRPVRLAVYEVNLHATEGSISQEALDQLTPSIGAGISVAEHMLLMLRELGTRDQNLFQLAQAEYLRSDKKHVKLWGAVVDMETAGLRRPQFLALQLVNRALGGQMMRTVQTGADPHWHQPAINGVKSGEHPYLTSFAFRKEGDVMLVLINRNRTNSLPVVMSGSLAPVRSLHRQYLHAPTITSNNEVSRTVVVTEDTVDSPTTASPLLLPPHSLTLLTWANSAK